MSISPFLATGRVDELRDDDTGYHTFILRAFVESQRIRSVPPVWRGTIRHLPDDVSMSVKSLEEVTSFIGRYLLEPELRDVPEDG